MVYDDADIPPCMNSDATTKNQKYVESESENARCISTNFLAAFILWLNQILCLREFL